MHECSQILNMHDVLNACMPACMHAQPHCFMLYINCSAVCARVCVCAIRSFWEHVHVYEQICMHHAL